MRVIIMRGLPGSGKTTYLGNNYPDATVCSADHYFVDSSGSYNFDPSKLPQAHQACMRKFISALQSQHPLVAVDNTHLSLWEFAPYVSVAEALGYSVELVRVEADPAACAERNVHGVSAEAISRMAGRFEKALPWWKETTVMKRRRERDASVALALRQADREDAPLFGMLFGDTES